jgi:penicillin-binding protein 1A
MPREVQAGFVAVEDRRFYSHDGVDLRGIGRAALHNLRTRSFGEGASTLTMQLARNVYGADLLSWHPIRRKLAEAVLAHEIERRLGKDRILELYLNQIYLGDGTWGVEAASRHYLGHPVSTVTPREAAFLVGLAKNPEGYDPAQHPEAARQRIATVVRVLEREGVLDRSEARHATAGSLETRRGASVREWGAHAYYVSAVRRRVREVVPNPAERNGLVIHTALDTAAQRTAQERLREHLEAVEAGTYGPFAHETGPGLEASDRLQGMVVVMDSRTGAIEALVGGRDFAASEFDRALQARRQPGSAFKPVVYAAALRDGFAMRELVPTAGVEWSVSGQAPWQIADGEAEGRTIRIREALVRSSNVAAVRTGLRVGSARVAAQARRMGLQGPFPSGPSLHLGTAEVVPARLVAAYAAVENGGRAVTPHLVTRIEDAAGRIVWERNAEDSEGDRVLDPARAFLLLDGLRGVVRRGTGWRVGAAMEGPAAGKTGTTDEVKDAWFVGMTPGRAAGVWIGFDRPRTIVPGGGGGTLAAPLWASIMGQLDEAHDAPGDPGWEPPLGVMKARIAVRTGFAVPEGCEVPGGTRTEWVLESSLRATYCPSHIPTPVERRAITAPPIRAGASGGDALPRAGELESGGDGSGGPR